MLLGGFEIKPPESTFLKVLVVFFFFEGASGRQIHLRAMIDILVEGRRREGLR